MSDRRDLELVLNSGVPIVVIETTDEARLLELLKDIALSASAAGYRPLFRWSVTDGLQRLDLALEAQRHNSEPADVLGHIRSVGRPGVYALLDFHPFLDNPVNTRLLKDIAIDARDTGTVVLLVGHQVDVPAELAGLSARFELSLPGADARREIVDRLVDDYCESGQGPHPEIDDQALELLITNLSGLSHADIERLARNAIFDDGVLDASDVKSVMQAKYELLNSGGVLNYEYDTTKFSDVAGFGNLKTWLHRRRWAFTPDRPAGLDPPKGVLLLGVQGCGKSLAAKAVAGAFGVPLLRLDFGAMYNKYHGETEKNLRAALKTAEVMSPCVLWLDEIEKGLSTRNHGDSGTSQRVLGALLTWMAERLSEVLLVATANEINDLPPELVRKGRFDEIFFVDLPDERQRAEILSIHLRKRGLEPADFDVAMLAASCEGFAGAEIEQAVVSALYAAYALHEDPVSSHILAELRRTRPLAVLMSEKINALRAWAGRRTVPADCVGEHGNLESRHAG